ncbi:MAG: prefoldin subunit beta [Nanoarchaeota archaeon]
MTNPETSQKIQELQALEQNHQAFLMQKQSIQMELNETLNALEEVKKTSGDVYRVLGNVMVKSDKEKIIKDLEEKKRISEMRVSAIEKQEKIIHSNIDVLKKEITSLISQNQKK